MNNVQIQQGITYHSIIAECDQLAHIEDTPLFNAIRDGKIIEIPWNLLTEAERRAAYVAAFYPCDWEVV